MFDAILKNNLSDKLNGIWEGLGYLLPEITLIVAFLGIILLDLIIKKHQKVILTTFLFIFLGICVASLLGMPLPEKLLFQDFLQINTNTLFLRLFLLVATFLCVLLYLFSSFYQQYPQHIGTFYTILLGMLLGLHFMVLSHNLMILFIAIEIVSISSYILATFSFGKRGSVVGIKYLLFGAMASSFMLYGMSWLYGLSGELSFALPKEIFVAGEAGLMPFIAVLFTLGGLLFKITAFPFHIWTPDVYEEAPTPIVAFFSVAPKLAGLAVLFSWASLWTFPIFSTATWQVHFRDILAIIAIISITWGNLSALSQSNFKRLLAYSSIAQAGFLLIPLVVIQPSASILLFYLLVYLLMNFLAFGSISFSEKSFQSAEIAHWRGVGNSSALLGVTVLIAMLSLTGLPPTSGFTAKLLVFSNLWASYQEQNSQLLLLLFIVGLLNTAIALFYYIKVPYFIFFKNAQQSQSISLSTSAKTILLVISLIILVMFFKADWFSF